MPRLIECHKLKSRLDGLDFPPYPGDIGQKIFNSISRQAWDMWISHQTMLINEYRLSMLEQNARQFLQDEMLKFLFGEGSSTPPGFKAQN